MNTRISEVLQGKEDNYIMPFFWQHGAEEEVLREYMGKIQDCGIGAVCLEARPHPDYVGPGWWHDVDIIMDEARRRGMRVWILDDSHFPTGYANGAMKDAPDHLKRWSLEEAVLEVVGPLKGFRLAVATDLGRRQMMGHIIERKGEALVAVVIGCRQEDENGHVWFDQLQDVTDKVKDGWLQIDFPKGNWHVFTYTKRMEAASKASDHISFLEKESCRILIDTVYEPHYMRYHEDFGKTFAGFFSDEPGFYNLAGNPFAIEKIGTKMPMPWSVKTQELFTERAGSLAVLPGLFHDLNGTEAKVRVTYMDIITRMYEENFSRQLGDWCEERGVEYIGHVLEDEGLHSRLGPGTGHYFRAMAGQHMGGIDIVLNAMIPDREYGHFGFYFYNLQVLAASVAHQNPRMRGRAMCEIFGAFGWSEGLSMMKWMADYMMVSGINWFVPHAFSEKEFPDPDCPPHFYAHGRNPQYRYMKTLFNYMNRVCHLMNGGTPMIDTAVLFPAEGEWAGSYRDFGVIGKICLTHQIPYDLVCCDSLEEARVCDGRIVVGNASYRTLLVDHIGSLPDAAVSHLERLAQEGAQICFVGLAAKGLDGEMAPSVPVIQDAEILTLLAQEKSCETRDLQESLRCYPFDLEKTKLYLLFNSSMCAAIETDICVPEAESYLLYHAEDNTFEKCMLKEDGWIHLSLERGESIILFAGDQDALPMESEMCFRPAVASEPISTLQGPYTVSLADYQDQENFQPLDTLHQLTDIAGLKSGFSGIIRYETSFTGRAAVLDVGEAYEAVEVIVNGRTAGVRVGYPYRYDVHTLCEEGENKLTILVATSLGNAMTDDLSKQRPFSPEGVLGPIQIFG